MRTAALLALTLLLGLAPAAALVGWNTPAALANESAAGAKDPARKITSQLICPCSCGEILSGCTCDTGKAMQAFVSDGLKGGKSKDQIVASLVAKYGEVIRGAPKAEGFNLIVWIAPFAATLLGFVIAGWILLRWVRRRAPVPVAGPVGVAPSWGGPAAAQDLDSLRARAESELERLRE
ncbi:MAG: cytochrome c-type biogenesis protein [Candidatus Eiseniibacteriota bacterium]